MQVDVSYNSINQVSALDLIAAMKGKPMVSIGMARCNLGGDGAKAVAELVLVTPWVTKISLAENKLGEEGTKAICEAIKTNSTLKELNLSGGTFTGSNIGGPAGAKHVADMLGANGSVTSVRARLNSSPWNQLTRFLLTCTD